MNILLWVLQGIFALHTIMGGAWKFSHTVEQTMPEIKVIPNGLWIGLGVFELFVGICFILPLVYKPASSLVSPAALFVALEMLAFCGLYLASGSADKSPLIYWGIVAILCGFIAYGRWQLSPL